MNTTAMVMTVAALGFCWIPGWGWIAIALAMGGLFIGILGMTSTKTSPSGLGMDVASWVYGILVGVAGPVFQSKAAGGFLDPLLLPLSMNGAAIASLVLLVSFIAVQLVARRRWRAPLVAVAFVLYGLLALCGWTGLTLADRAGISLITM